MKFAWDLSEKYFDEYKNHQQEFKDKEEEDRTYIGSVRTGDLCFDIMNWGSHLWFDLYVGGVDTGYGYSDKEGYKGDPSDDCDAARVRYNRDVSDISLQEFKKELSEKIIKHLSENREYTTDIGAIHVDLLKKAEENLKMW